MALLVSTFIDNLNYALRNSSEKLADDTEKLFWLNKTVRQLDRVLFSMDSDLTEQQSPLALASDANSVSGPTRCHSVISPIRIVAGAEWVTLAVYAVGDYVFYDTVLYICATAHTAGTWATDLAAAKWTVTRAINRVHKADIQQIRDLRASLGTATGQPRNYTMRGTTIEFDYTADADYILMVNFNQKLLDRIDSDLWVTGTAYVVGDYVNYGGVGYICATNNTAGTWATDLAAAKWTVDAALSMPYNDEFNDTLEQAAVIFIKNVNEWDTAVDGAVYQFLWKAASVDLVKRRFVPKRTRLDF